MLRRPFLPKHFAEVNANPQPYPDSEDDMSRGTATAVSPKTIQMGVTPASVDVEPKDTLEFTNNSAKFPRFEVVFQGSSPNGSGLTFPGTTTIDIPVTKAGTFDYLIRHFPKSGPSVVTGTFTVRSCKGGCPQ
jgi:plastocyanin